MVTQRAFGVEMTPNSEAVMSSCLSRIAGSNPARSLVSPVA